jgi:hypothetical protein
MLACTTCLTHNLRNLLLAIGLGMATGCSTMPEASYPPHCDHELLAEFVVPADGWLPVPSSTRHLVVRELASEPPAAGERFDAAEQRYLAFPAGSRITLRCGLRCYATAHGQLPELRELLPHAVTVRSLPSP